jgi:hypothetical protein
MEGNIDIVRGVLHVLCERLRNIRTSERVYHDPPPPATES